MKLADVIRIAGPFLATDKKPEDLQRAILAADKKAKDADPENTGMGPKNLQHTEDAALDEREEAMDEREEAMDAAEEKADAGKEDKEAKDRKGARDKRAKDRMDRKGARDKRAKDRGAKDRDDDPEHTNDENYAEGADPSPPGGNREKGKTAVDSAEVDRRIAAAVAARDALHTARVDVQPVIGVTTFDSAGDTYRAALKHLGVETDGIPASAYPAMLKLAKDRVSSQPITPVAMDAAVATAAAKAFPGINRLRR